ncbi:aminotransferase class V-fold PLP-dependent enzyme [Actinomadura spongiicola]|uniref:Aminotransferase class V-fold PLP-dependent enzyme n=1 Tax=Actinomadura spongiicola TaxID=2303421 RepID=A0A372GCE9_9ACTN|nr:aminotransferase class V-fold PLP-dependent enzyme [Actinomadura spongiicola]RFS83066.1 aminotransferase class V-fold PLP-dependent enzyme [Actinomadura spongiicola]
MRTSPTRLVPPARSHVPTALTRAEGVPVRGLPRVVGADVPVPIRGGGHVPYANLDHAASAPCLEAVHEAVTRALPYYSSVHRGTGRLSRVTTDAYEAARETVRAFVGAWRRSAVVFTRNTTDSMNLLAHAAPTGTSVVVFETEHHASLLPWKRAVRLPAPATPAEAVSAADRALRESPIGPRLLVVTAASNVTGELWPIGELAHVARRNGARIAVDAAQLVPHRPLDMTALDLDYVAFSGHKLYAPFGAGVLAGRADWLRAADPYLKGGGASASVGRTTRWAAAPEPRHEAGTPNVLGVIALAAACETLSERWDAMIAHEEALVTRLRSGLATLAPVHELSLWGEGAPRVGIVSFTVDGWNARDVALTLSEEYGIGVRDGRFCAHPFVRHLLGGDDAVQDTAVRAGLGLGTSEEHVDRLLTALAELTCTVTRAAG